MRDVTGDLWTVAAQAVVVPTNAKLRRDGSATMGAGVALQAAKRYPQAPLFPGSDLALYGPRVVTVAFDQEWQREIVAFPTKYDPWQDADLALIEQSAQQLLRWADNRSPLGTFALPRVGAGLGGLDWKVVRDVLEEYLDDRFVVVSR